MNKKKFDVTNTEYSDLDNSTLITKEDEKIIQDLYDKIKAKDLLSKPSKQPKPPIIYINGEEDCETMHYHKNAWMQTYTGKKFHPLDPKIEDVDINDIAHALSMICRFTGHVKKFYSVGQHSILASYICDYKDRLSALLHDGSEAYLTDLVRPLKQSGGFDNYLDYEKKLQTVIYKKFGLPEDMPVSVKKADNILLTTEARDLMCQLQTGWYLAEKPLPFKIEPLSQPEIEKMFLERYYELTNDEEM